MKYIGALLIMCGCVALSYFYGKKEKNKISDLLRMRDFILYVKTRIDLFLTPKERLFCEYDDPFIKSLYESSFKDLRLYFDKNDCEYLNEFFYTLGKGMKDEELALCEYTVLQLNKSIDKAEADIKNKIKVFRTIAIFGGASLVILII